jgi:hypothetical protein
MKGFSGYVSGSSGFIPSSRESAVRTEKDEKISGTFPDRDRQQNQREKKPEK